MNAIINAIFILARAQLVEPRSETPASDSIEDTGMQLQTFRTHSAPDPIAEPLYAPPFIHPYSESEKGMMYGSTSRVVRSHFRSQSSGSSITVDTASTSTDVNNMSFSPIMESSSS